MIRDARVNVRPLVIVALALIGCANDDGGSSERVTSLVASRTWDSLSANDRDQVCDETQDYYDNAFAPEELDRLDCAGAALSVGSLDFSFTQDSATATASCKTAFENCLADPPGTQSSPLSVDCSFEEYVDCTFFIAEYEACVVTRVDAASEDIAEFTCDDVDWTDPAAIIGSGKTEQCQRLFDKCP